jgi:hypothetical protein
VTKRSRTTAPSKRLSEARALRALPHRVIPNKKRSWQRERPAKHVLFHDTSDNISHEDMAAFIEEIDDGESI